MSSDDDFSVSGSDDDVTEVEESGWGSRFGSSIAGVIIGFLLFLASFALLYWNEGRAVSAMSALDAGARAVVSVAAETVSPANEGHLVHVVGTAAVAAPVEDPVFHVGGGGLMRLKRHVEMYQWHQGEETKTEKSLGGTETKTTTYHYSKEWSDQPIDSGKFKKREGHVNPPMTYPTASFEAPAVKVGAFSLDRSQVAQFDSFETMMQPPAAAAVPDGFRWVGSQLVHGSPDSPQIGDVRITFSSVPVQTVSVVGAQIGDGLAAFTSANGRAINIARTGRHGADELFQEAKHTESLITWLVRGGGFLMMFFGVLLVTGPLSWLASVVPFLEGIVDAAAALVALIVAVPLTLITIALAWVAHRPLIGGGLIIAGIALAVLIRWVAPSRRRAPAVVAPST